jgi:hypothetical protein
MRLRSSTARLRATSPVVEGLETRALLSQVATSLAALAEHPAARHRIPPIIAQLPKAPRTTTSTVPSTGDVNPYGVAFVPGGFASGGVLNPGDVLVSNFNNSKNLQGTGTTIMRITPQGQASVFYQGPPGIGLSTALGVLQAGYVVVGAVPSTDGTSATVGQGELLVLDKNGKLVQTLSDPNLLDGPWDLTISDQGTAAQIFVANVLNGTVSRLNVNLPATGGFQVASTTQLASDYTHRGDPAAFELGPTGLAFNPATHTLFVASTADNQIYAIAGADTAGNQTGTGTVVYKDKAHLHGPLGLTFAPDGNLIAAQGDAINPSKHQTSELVEFTPAAKGKFVGQFSLSKTAGGAFGVATSSAGTEFAAVNDITNTVEVWKVSP